MELSVKNLQGDVVASVEVSDRVFGVPFNAAVVHQVMVAHLANGRIGSHSTKTRAQVRGGKKKPWRQKGTGRARQGSTRGPHWRHGGVAHGPHPHSYHQNTPRKVRRLAIRCLLSQRVREEQLTVVEGFGFSALKTKEAVRLLADLGITSKCLVVSGEEAAEIGRACHNLPRVKALPTATLNTLDLLNYDHLLMNVSAVRRAEELWAHEHPRAGGRPKIPGEEGALAP